MADQEKLPDSLRPNKATGVSFAGRDVVLDTTEFQATDPVQHLDRGLFTLQSDSPDESQGICLRSVIDLDTGKRTVKWSFAPDLVQHYKLACQQPQLRPSLDGSSVLSEASVGRLLVPSSLAGASSAPSVATTPNTSPKLSASSTLSLSSQNPGSRAPTANNNNNVILSKSNSGNSNGNTNTNGLPTPSASLFLEPLTLQQTDTDDCSNAANLHNHGQSHSLSNNPSNNHNHSSSNSHSHSHSCSHDGALVAAAAGSSVRASPPRSRGPSKQSHTFTCLAQESHAIAEEEADLEVGAARWKIFPFYRSLSSCSGGPCPTPTSSSSSKGGVSLLFHSEQDRHLELLPELVTFEGSQELLRASPLNSIMKWQGWIFGSSAGSSSTFDMSREVPQIHTFLSHNWSTSRRRKYLGIAHHFNFHIAQAVSLLALVVIAILSIMGKVPLVRHPSLEHPVGWLARTTVYPLFMLLLFFQRDFLRLFGLRGPDVFLDKTCIHQVDLNLKQKGIEKLPAFLSNSQYMLALYTDSTYLQKMWTVYEVAAFLALRPSRNMILCELDSMPMLYGCLFLGWCLTLTRLGLEMFTGLPKEFQIMTGSASMVAFMLLFRHWAVKRACIWERLRTFDVYSCKCSLETDRSTLLGNIAVLMRTRANLPNASDEEALAFFNQLARAELPQVFRSAIHPLGLSYRHILTFISVYSGASQVDRLFVQDQPLQQFMGTLAGTAFWWVIGFPLCFAALQYAVSSYVHLRGWRAWIRLTILLLLLCEPFVGLFYLTDRLQESAGEGSLASWTGLAIVWVLGGAALPIVYSNWFWELKLPCTR